MLRRLAEERELVAAGTPVLVLGAQDRGFVVRTGLADREIVQVSSATRRRSVSMRCPTRTLDGSVTRSRAPPIRASGMFMVEVALDAGDQPLKSGLVAKLDHHARDARAAARASTCPSARSSKATDVARASSCSRTTAPSAAKSRSPSSRTIRVALTSGVDAGEQVVTDGALYLEDGELVAGGDAERARSDVAAMQLPVAIQSQMTARR